MRFQGFWPASPHASGLLGSNSSAIDGGPRHREAGFTLVEVLVSLVLLALLLSLVPATFRMARQSWQAEVQLERSAALSTATDTLRRMLASALPLPAPRAAGQSSALVFDGQSESIAFVAPAPSGLETGGIQVFTLSSKSRDRSAGRHLVLTVSAYSPGDRDALGIRERSGSSETVLAEDIGMLRLRYFGPSVDGGEPLWHDSWVQRTSLPLLIDIRFSLSGANRVPERIAIAPRHSQSK